MFFSPSYGLESPKHEWAEAQDPPSFQSVKRGLRAVQDVVGFDATQ